MKFQSNKNAKWIFVTLLVLLTAIKSSAQKNDRLTIQPERMQKVRKQEQEANDKNNPLLLAEAYYQYGIVYSFAGNYTASKTYYIKALRILEPRGDSYELGMLYYRLSQNLGIRADLQEEIQYAHLALVVFERIKSPKGLAYAYRAIGGFYSSMGLFGPKNKMHYDSALYYYKQSELNAMKINDTLNIADINIHIGTLYQGARNRKAITFFKKALKIFSSLNTVDSYFGTVHTLLSLGSTYTLFKEYDEAYRTLVEAEKFYKAKNLNEHHIQSRILENFRRFYESRGQWKLAYNYLTRLHILHSDDFKTQYSTTVARLNVEYETDKKEEQLRIQKEEIRFRKENLRIQQYLIIAVSVLLITAIVVSIIFFRLYRKNQRTSNRNEQLVWEQNHRVKNNLQIISSLLNMQARLLLDSDAKKAVEESRLRVQSMAIIQRKLYNGDSSAHINLAEFIPELTNGVLHAFGYSEAVTNFNIEPIKLDTDKTVSLGLILTELVTNACKYAFPTNPRPVLNISCKKLHHKIQLSVADNGMGIIKKPITDTFPTTTGINSNKDSFGMQLIQLQVQQLYGNHKFTYKEGTKFIMEFSN